MFARLRRPRTKARVAQLELRIAQLEAALAATQQSVLKSNGEALKAHGESLIRHGEGLRGHGVRLLAVEQRLAEVSSALSGQLLEMHHRLTSATQAVTAISSVTRMQQIWTVMRWLAQAPGTSDVLISVVMPTRNRRNFLARAIASVLAQTHSNFELVIVDDASTDDTPELLDTIEDKRVRRLRGQGLGAAAARNLGLDAASGAIITHFDDDNLMDPNWLRGVAWGFARWPETELLYGARILEDPAARNGIASGAMPLFEWQPYDRATLETYNYIDMNVLAHRANLPEARFDQTLPSCMDWDLILRLTANRVPLELPVIACLYSNSAPNRLGDRPTRDREFQLVRARVHTTRPMRVLSYNALFPQLCETYIEEEMLALEAAGAQIAFVSTEHSVSPSASRHKLFATLEAAVAAQDPDIIVLYGTTHATAVMDHLTRIGRPFALRVHSSDCDTDGVARTARHPYCVGICAFPQHAEHAHAPAPIFMADAAMTEPEAGGECIENERKANHEWEMQQFYDPSSARVFHDALSAALVAWRERRANVG